MLPDNSGRQQKKPSHFEGHRGIGEPVSRRTAECRTGQQGSPGDWEPGPHKTEGPPPVPKCQVRPTASRRLSGRRIFERIDSAHQPKVLCPEIRQSVLGKHRFSATSSVRSSPTERRQQCETRPGIQGLENRGHANRSPPPTPGCQVHPTASRGLFGQRIFNRIDPSLQPTVTCLGIGQPILGKRTSHKLVAPWNQNQKKRTQLRKPAHSSVQPEREQRYVWLRSIVRPMANGT